MSFPEDEHHEKMVAISRWADTYTSRLDKELTNAWPDLADRLEAGISTLSWYELAFGVGEDFQKRCLSPAVDPWVERYVHPIIADTSEELHRLLPKEQGALTGSAPSGFDRAGNLETLDVVKALTLPAGLLLAGGAVSVAIATTTKLLIFTTVVVHWPLLIAGLIIGGFLALFGGTQLQRLKSDLRERFQSKLLPRIKEALVGEGVEQDGKKIPSLLRQLQDKVRETAEAARTALA